MSRIIAIYGQDGNGKTTLSYALANQLADKTNMVLIVHTDYNKSVMSERMPELQNSISLGQLLMTEEYYNLDKSFVPYALNENVFASGIVNSENYTSYERCSLDTAKRYFEILVKIFDYIIVDTTDDLNDTLAVAGLAQAGIVIELLSANIQGVIFQNAYNLIFDKLDTKGKTIFAAAKLQPYQNMAIVENMLNVKFKIKLPYSNEVDFKNMSGSTLNGFAKKDGIAYEREIQQLQKLVG